MTKVSRLTVCITLCKRRARAYISDFIFHYFVFSVRLPFGLQLFIAALLPILLLVYFFRFPDFKFIGFFFIIIDGPRNLAFFLLMVECGFRTNGNLVYSMGAEARWYCVLFYFNLFGREWWHTQIIDWYYGVCICNLIFYFMYLTLCVYSLDALHLAMNLTALNKMIYYSQARCENKIENGVYIYKNAEPKYSFDICSTFAAQKMCVRRRYSK